MTIDELISEGESLARRSFLLGSAPTESGIVGYWGGARTDMPDELLPEVTAFAGRRHIFSLSEKLLAELRIKQGPMSLFEWTSVNGDASFRVETDHRLLFSELSFSGEPLYATPADSFPPFPAVCLYGSEKMAEWLRGQGLSRHEYWRVTSGLPDEYEAVWQERAPFFQQTADVVVGGWHFLWPDDDFYIPPEVTLAALTLRDAEPWMEIWHSPAHTSWRARARTT